VSSGSRRVDTCAAEPLGGEERLDAKLNGRRHQRPGSKRRSPVANGEDPGNRRDNAGGPPVVSGAARQWTAHQGEVDAARATTSLNASRRRNAVVDRAAGSRDRVHECIAGDVRARQLKGREQYEDRASVAARPSCTAPLDDLDPFQGTASRARRRAPEFAGTPGRVLPRAVMPRAGSRPSTRSRWRGACTLLFPTVGVLDTVSRIAASLHAWRDDADDGRAGRCGSLVRAPVRSRASRMGTRGAASASCTPADAPRRGGHVSLRGRRIIDTMRGDGMKHRIAGKEPPVTPSGGAWRARWGCGVGLPERRPRAIPAGRALLRCVGPGRVRPSWRSDSVR